MQCGYCTPGWLTGTAALLARTPHPDDAQDRRRASRPRLPLLRVPADPAGDPPRRRADGAPGATRAGAGRARRVRRRRSHPAAPGVSRGIWRRAQTRSRSRSAMPEGLLTVVADDSDGEPDSGGPDDAWVHVGADGSITAFTGKVEAGQGTRTALALLVAEELAVPADLVRLAMADTDVSPFDLGHVRQQVDAARGAAAARSGGSRASGC